MPRRLTTLPPTKGPMPRDQWLALRLSISDERKQQFLAALADSFSVTVACDAVGISRQSAYRWRAEDDTFSAAWDEALFRCTDAIESVMFKQAIAGQFLPGIALLKGALPMKYRDNAPLPAQQVQARQSLRFLTDGERDDAIDAQYRQIPERAGDGD